MLLMLPFFPVDPSQHGFTFSDMSVMRVVPESAAGRSIVLK